MDKAIVRQRVEKIDGVSRTWFEWSREGKPLSMIKTLVVEVEFDTDPNSLGYRQNALDEIVDTAVSVLQNETTMAVSHLRIVPKR